MSNALQFQFQNWEQGEPNDYKNEEDEDCVEVKSSGVWNDVSCSTKFGAICKRGNVTRRLELKFGQRLLM